jgi:hypothetical protein
VASNVTPCVPAGINLLKTVFIFDPVNYEYQFLQFQPVVSQILINISEDFINTSQSTVINYFLKISPAISGILSYYEVNHTADPY